MSDTVGFVGLGIMGRPMALNLRRAGHAMRVHARRADSMKPLVEAGATACATPREVAAGAGIMFVCVADTPDVEQVIFGEQGLVHGAQRGSVVVDMSTISPEATRRMAARLAERGVEMLDAPVSGGEAGATQGTLSIMVGGKPAVFGRVRPFFEAMGKHIVHIGDHGAGQVAKACNQIVAAVTIEAVAEAIAFARRSGVDAAKVREALLGGFAYSKVLEVHGQRMIARDFRPGFKTRLHQKDIGIVLNEARELGIALPATALVAQHLNALARAGAADHDSSALIEVIERMSGGDG